MILPSLLDANRKDYHFEEEVLLGAFSFKLIVQILCHVGESYHGNPLLIALELAQPLPVLPLSNGTHDLPLVPLLKALETLLGLELFEKFFPHNSFLSFHFFVVEPFIVVQFGVFRWFEARFFYLLQFLIKSLSLMTIIDHIFDIVL